VLVHQYNLGHVRCIVDSLVPLGLNMQFDKSELDLSRNDVRHLRLNWRKC